MRRALIFAALLPTPVLADDFYTSAPVASVVLYPQGAVQTHKITLDLPAGEHRIFLPMITSETQFGLPTIKLGSGDAVLGALSYLPDSSIDPKTLFTPAQRTAFDKVEAAKNAIKAHGETLTAVQDDIAALQGQLDFVTSISAPSDAASVEDLTAMLGLVGNQSKDIRAQISAKTRALTDEAERRAELDADLTNAQRAFDRLSVPKDNPDLLSIPVHLETAQTVTILIDSKSYGGGWVPIYDVHLNEGDSPSLTIGRNFAIDLPREAVWNDVDLTLSTLRPSEQVEPSTPQANHASIHKPALATRKVQATSEMMDMAAAPMAEPALMEVQDSRGMEVDTGGIAVSYHYSQKVTALAGDAQILELDSRTLPVTTEIYAIPRRDETAFLVAQLENTTAEPFLGGAATIFRGETLIGEVQMPFLAAGDDITLPFGPIEGIRLEHIVADNETGDRGIISTTNTREQDTSFRVTNLTGEAQKIRAFYPLTYSEQEDLEVEVTATPRPDEVNHDDKRGLSVWDLDVAAGTTKEVTINTSLSWPEGYQLNWQPW
mgnify:CR=1 FL=1